MTCAVESAIGQAQRPWLAGAKRPGPHHGVTMTVSEGSYPLSASRHPGTTITSSTHDDGNPKGNALDTYHENAPRQEAKSEHHRPATPALLSPPAFLHHLQATVPDAVAFARRAETTMHVPENNL